MTKFRIEHTTTDSVFSKFSIEDDDLRAEKNSIIEPLSSYLISKKDDDEELFGVKIYMHYVHLPAPNF